MPKPTHRLVTSALHRVRLPVGRLRRSLEQFQPLMPCTPSDGAGDYVAGKCLWGLVGAKEMVAVCWDWVGWWWDDTWVVALANPMAITSNVILLDDAGVPLKSSAALLEFNTAVHCLKWQGWVTSEVCARARSTASRKVVQTESPRCPLEAMRHPALGCGTRPDEAHAVALAVAPTADPLRTGRQVARRAPGGQFRIVTSEQRFDRCRRL